MQFSGIKPLLSVLLVLLVNFLASSIFAAELNGTVRDHVGATQPKATVILLGQNAKLERRFKTAADGHYTFTAVPTDRYEVMVRSTCFRMAKKRVRLQQHSRVTLDFALELQNSHCSGID